MDVLSLKQCPHIASYLVFATAKQGTGYCGTYVMFDFKTGLDLSKHWQQGPCHKHSMLEQILDKWLRETESFIKNILGNPYRCKQGRFQYLPQKEEVNTSVFDTCTGKTADIPTSTCKGLPLCAVGPGLPWFQVGFQQASQVA